VKALLDLFARHRGRETGIWTLGQDPQRVVFLEQGGIAFAQSTHPLDKLTTLLVERGKLTQAQLDYALQNLKPGLSIGRNLIEMGFITQRDLLEMAKAQVERVVWGAMGDMEEEPRFQAKALDASVVRLSLDTPLTLLVGCLHLRDRERLLELLGPLDQKLHLETFPDLNLPPDLVKVPALLDGQRRLLDLAQDAGVEPMRLGAFALFLREMGWARLSFGAPSAEPEPRIELIPPPAPPSLVASIEAAERPTVDLHHLAGPLDALDEWEPPAASEKPLEALDPEPDLRIHAEPAEASDFPAERGSRKGLWLLLLLILGGGGAYGGWRWSQTAAAKGSPASASSAPQPESEVLTPAPAPRDLLSVAATPKAEPPVASSPKVAPAAPPELPSAPRSDADPSQDARWSTLHRGDWEAGLREGLSHKAALKDAWVLRLEIACQPDTLARAVAAFKAPADLFLVPMAMKDGRTCRQVCLGRFGSEAEARAAIETLPALFTQGGNKPHPFQASALPEKQ